MRISNTPRLKLKWTQRCYTTLGRHVIALGSYAGESKQYDQVNQQMYLEFGELVPSAEITLFAVDPALTGHHIGSRLLHAFEQYASHELIYLYTDSDCNYPFYFKRQFNVLAQRKIHLDENDPASAALTCFLLYKQL
ncbi:GNAT family N-acetyltransferase [Levilactobacillus suantsaii]|uniref:GNAT family N-acetyltransferase n=1 Tax=Levilactobacillus suantsaii TaxID=2292255 RepID=A0A4Q0VHW3_9LACO|nr:GNAT family N-acetyltransferase [Levilactobacillus suantsaii]QMU08775.1 GNAT family N-acetyltransferase [Levilactobacillus suantsaii]RXI78946.1 GNAT family N-acetyltransferase [Levilactobacillus suantsaii]